MERDNCCNNNSYLITAVNCDNTILKRSFFKSSSYNKKKKANNKSFKDALNNVNSSSINNELNIKDLTQEDDKSFINQLNFKNKSLTNFKKFSSNNSPDLKNKAEYYKNYEDNYSLEIIKPNIESLYKKIKAIRCLKNK
ncbi:hypothetical protein SAMN05421842_10576 [Clostridium uliginosum]|uniref:Uncharacterized protein n=2 Tax=Clostridium uliginosum TaxID=119641 RepID=A0A1I1KBN1_9CLOT|nr:hypothetical protein SAMN05421842_10576 [Clostridium uliginosum]